MSRTIRLLVFWSPVVLYAIVIFYLSSKPLGLRPLQNIKDYYLHIAEYCIFYVTIFWALHEGFRPNHLRGSYWLPAVLTVVYGMLDEYHQSFVPNRDASVLDVISDSVGAVMGMLVVLVTQRLISLFRPKGWT